MRAVKKIKGILFNIHEIVWWFVAEIEDWLYPYKDRLTPEDRFEIRVKDPILGDEYMVEQVIQALNEKVDKLQDQMMDVNHRLQEHDKKLQFRIRAKQSSPSVSGKVSNV
tara:strand:+ start:1611 stop:1940 length:330 start_codon:yes stop_codon:yes gene_type:complete